MKYSLYDKSTFFATYFTCSTLIIKKKEEVENNKVNESALSEKFLKSLLKDIVFMDIPCVVTVQL